MSQVTVSTAPTRKRTRESTVVRKKSKTGVRRFARDRSIANIGKGFPDKLQVVHRYVQGLEMIMAATSIARVTYKCNGLYDPEDAIGGHQPFGYDQMTPIYDHYAVYESRIKVTFVPNYPNEPSSSGTDTGPFICAVYQDDDTTGATDIQTLIESQNSSQYKVLPGNQGPVTLYSKWTPARKFGSKPLDNPRLQGTAGADPTELSHFHVVTYNTSAVAGNRYVYILAEIEYRTTWFELKTLAGS